MAISSWSNPTGGSGVYASQATRGAQIQPINIAGLVAAIIQNKQHQQAQQQQAINQISSGISSIGQAYQGGQQDDLANRAIYMAQNPQGDIGPDGQRLYGSALDARVPDYGGTQGLQAQRIASQLQDEQARRDLNPYRQQLLQAQIDATKQRAAGGGITPNARAVQERFEEKQRIAALDKQLADAKAGYTALGIPPELLTSTSAVHAHTYAKPEDGTEAIPDGSYRLDIPAKGNTPASTKDINASEFDSAHKAYDRYQQLLQQRAQVGSEPSGGGNVNSQISQIKAAYSAGTMSRAEASAALQALGIAP